MPHIIELKLELDHYKLEAQRLQKQIIQVCQKTVVDSDILRILHKQRKIIQKKMLELSSKLTSDIIA